MQSSGRLQALAIRYAQVPTYLAVLSVTCVVGGLYLHWRTVSGSDVVVHAWPADYVAAVTYPTVGAFLVRRRPDNPVGWAMSFASLLGLYVFCAEYAVLGVLARPGSLPFTDFATWVATWGWLPHLVIPTLVPLLFPDGRLLSHRWRVFAGFLTSLVGVSLLARMFAPTTTDYSPLLTNPYALEYAEWLNWIVRGATWLIFIIGAPACVIALVLRQRRSRGVERAQMQWLMTSGVLTVVVITASFFISEFVGSITWSVMLVVVPVSLVIAVVKHQLLDIELVLNRAVVYLALTALVLIVYFGGVAAVSLLDLGDRVAFAIVAVAALLAASVRSVVQTVVTRLLFGARRNPYEVVTRVGGRLDLAKGPADALQTLVDELRSSLKLPFVRIEASQTFSSGVEVGHIERIPILSQGARVGTLVVGHRHPSERFVDDERTLLVDVARRAGAFLRANSLLIELQQSREGVVIAREEERLRLRNDLHDGIGPELAGIALQLDALSSRIDHEQAREQLGQLRDKVRGTVKEVRRVVEGLRPGSLDQLGFAGALNESVERFAGDGWSLGLSIGDLPLLPPAVEVAAFRIVNEALNNASRHSNAQTCQVTVTVDGDELSLEVSDDGDGLDVDHVPGVGLRSMQDRAGELGGSFEMSSSNSGTAVRVRLPRHTR